ncbi:hypothetical protein LguiB_022889 [Lonicera macranthoides]
MMRFLKRFSLVQIQRKLLFHTQPKQERPNETLKRYLNSKSPTKALLLFANLLRKNTSLIDSFSLLFVIKACTHKSSLLEGKQIHALAIKLGYVPIIFLQTSLINMYSKAANLGNAYQLFEEIPTKNVVCWTALIAAYVDNQKPNKALQLFRKMQFCNVEPDQVTLTVALSACADIGALEMGEWIHSYVRRKKEMNTDLRLNNALINMYAKCGDIETAKVLFKRTKKKDVTTWTSMIVGYALHGQAEEALVLFAKMKLENKTVMTTKRNVNCTSRLIVPNDVTFIGVLMACSHAGMVEEGKRHFKSMTEDYGLKPRASHFGCVVDLLCRAGLLREAYDFVLAMPVNPNAVVWRTLLGACSTHGNVELATEAHLQLLKLEERVVSDSVVMSNIYAAKGMWDKKMAFREEMKHRRAPGCSSIEVESGVSEFVTADDDHPFGSEIYEVLLHLIENMRACGYAPEILSPVE